MAYLPVRPDLDQLRHQAKDLLHTARRGDPDALARIRAVSGRIILSSAQLAIAREYGFASWARSTTARRWRTAGPGTAARTARATPRSRPSSGLSAGGRTPARSHPVRNWSGVLSC
jgi:hypothetical protein